MIVFFLPSLPPCPVLPVISLASVCNKNAMHSFCRLLHAFGGFKKKDWKFRVLFHFMLHYILLFCFTLDYFVLFYDFIYIMFSYFVLYYVILFYLFYRCRSSSKHHLHIISAPLNHVSRSNKRDDEVLFTFVGLPHSHSIIYGLRNKVDLEKEH